jgi:peptide/nickel transport system substrate-binding protein
MSHRALVLVAAGLVCHCGQDVTPRDSSGETLTIAARADVTGFFPNPPFTNEAFTQAVNWNVVAGLVRFDSQSRPVPALAHTWESPDERTYVFHLRPGTRFSNGDPVAASDVVASFETARARGLPPQDALNAIESIAADGPRRVRIRTRSVDPFLVYRLPFGFVIPEEAFENDPADVIGAGPYSLASWTPSQEFVLERNPYYWGEPPGFERVRFRVEPDAEKRLGLLLSGAAQLADHVPLDRLEALRNEPSIEVFSALSTRVLFLVLDVAEAPFSDPRVREALDLAIDREELIRRALAGAGRPASQLVPVSILGYNSELEVTPANRERARRLLAEAGYPEGFSIRLDGTHNRYVRDRQILEELSRQLSEVGVRVQVNALDKHEFFPMISRGESRFHLLGWTCDTGEAGSVLEAKIHTRQVAGLGNDNVSGFSDARVDELIRRSNESVTQAERVRLLQQALARVAELRPVLPLLVQPEAVAVSRTIRWEPTLKYALRLEELRPAE